MNQNSSRPTNPRSTQQSRDGRPSFSSNKKRSNDSHSNSYSSQGNSSYSSQGNGSSSQGERSSSSSRPSYQGSSNGGERSSYGSSNSSQGGRSYGSSQGGRSSYGSSSQGGRSSYGSQGGYGGGRNRRPSKKNTLDISAFINRVTADTTPAAVFVPKHQFAELNLHADLLKNLETRGFVQPTPIQDAVIPSITNNNQDLVGLANTGTGKTGAFLIPLINKALTNRDQQTLILAPTRELAVQIEKEFYLLSRNLRLTSVVIVGGAPIWPQMQKAKTFNNFVVGTPGRVIDLIKRGALKLENFKTAVLDEADRMLDMGFITDIKYILSHLPEERQTLFFSATLSSEIKGLISDFLKNPINVSVKTGDTSKNIHQDVVRMNGRSKIDVLQEMLSQAEFSKVLAFGKTKHGVDKIYESLIEVGIKAESIHGNKSHGQRQRALQNFKNDRAKILIATDVAARGIDISGITHVINFDTPQSYDDYIHRIGRTGRGNQKGVALTFID
ncbi:DEAD/DEAH box helicase [Candidatus Chromulinivorax destructor]|uniref:ATP-dependent helicase n=1 Tax=Candidatus Chromulinivorax destructor TaxID=2066483 RepID=A0A345ZAG1_9BACT|nr:DEAD/DEAH box helicase [Candidatus Chromulinivorax destructor]AXK60278.1 ATP-dependent helicase [Candidatus Chromulinivorax destructor]